MGIISIDSGILEQYQKKFTIAHELGHYFNSGKKENSYFCSGLDIRGIKQSISAEIDANEFAAELLMHEEWFRSYTRGKKFEKEILSGIAGSQISFKIQRCYQKPDNIFLFIYRKSIKILCFYQALYLILILNLFLSRFLFNEIHVVLYSLLILHG